MKVFHSKLMQNRENAWYYTWESPRPYVNYELIINLMYLKITKAEQLLVQALHIELQQNVTSGL
jgi:hypothetical protein